jgi:hypothetical protein
MTVIWDIYWPAIVAAAIIALIGGRLAFSRPRVADDASKEHRTTATRAYRSKRGKYLLLTLGAALTVVAVFHWTGGGERLAGKTEAIARKDLVYWEMQRQVTASAARGPLSRDIILTGRADDFQRSELPRVMEQLPGLGDVRWQDQPRPRFAVPLIVEVLCMALLALLAGLLLSYLIEIRRRANAEWSW